MKILRLFVVSVVAMTYGIENALVVITTIQNMNVVGVEGCGGLKELMLKQRRNRGMTGAELARARKRFNIPIRELAKQLPGRGKKGHVHYMTVWAWEQGKRPIPEVMQLRLGQIFWKAARPARDLVPCDKCDGTGLIEPDIGAAFPFRLDPVR